MRALAVLTVRNEAAFLIEWLAHHRAIGFTDFLVCSNDCDDGTDLMLDRLQELGVLTHLRNDPPHNGGIQWAALKQADRHPLVQQADWIMALDIDEFVNIHTGDHTLGALIAALPDATAITLTWRLFGNAGVVRFKDAPITDQFTRAAPAVMHWPWRAAMFKTLYRNNGTYRKLGVHRPRSPDKPLLPQARWFDGSGRALPAQFATQRIFSDYGQDNYQLAQMNHYPLGAMESYLLKVDRGRAVHDADTLGMDYWVERNFNTEEDHSISSTSDLRSQHIDQLMRDTDLQRLHTAAVAWRMERYDRLMLDDSFRALFGRLLMTAPSKPVSSKAAQYLIRFAHRSQSTSN